MSHKLLFAVQEDHKNERFPTNYQFSVTHTLKFAVSATKEGPSSWLGFIPEPRPRKSCKKYNVEKDSSEPGIRARGDLENVAPLLRNSEK